MYTEYMPITLKNPRVEEMAREVARLSGRSLTDAIGHALDGELRQLKQSRLGHRRDAVLLDIAKRCGSLPDLDARSADEILGYGADGVTPHGG